MNNNYPFFSIIVPTYAREAHLKKCMGALSSLSYPKNRFEVIVVNDDNNSSLKHVLTPFFDQLDLHLVSQNHAGPAAARNTGGKQAKGEYLAFTDDDCMPAADWLTIFAQHFSKTPDCAVAGKTINGLSGNPYSSATQHIIDFLYAHYNVDSENAQLAISSNFALPLKNFRALGGFSTDFKRAAGEDRDLSARWLQHGFRIIYAPDALVNHCHPLSLQSFLKKHYNYGRGAYQFHQNRIKPGQTFKFPEPLSFYAKLLTWPVSKQPKSKTVFTVLLLTFSQISTIAGYLIEGSKKTLSLTRKKYKPV